MNKSIKHNRLITIVLSSIILCSWAFYNTFPLFFNSDTAMYLEAAFRNEIREDRPIFYGLFMRFVGFQHSLWPVIIVQSLILSYLINIIFSNYLKHKYHPIIFLVFITMISCFMGGSFISSWLMPDVFAPISILCLGILLFVNTSTKIEYIFISVILVISIGMHNSHFFICLGLICLFILGFTIKPLRQSMLYAGIKLKRVFYIFLLVICANFFWSTVNYAYSRNYKNHQSGVIFLMGNLVDMGIMDAYLAETCDKKNYQICQFKDTLPNNFIWARNSPLYKCGGWERCETEYTEIIKDILITPKFIIPTIYKSMLLAVKQFFLFDTGEAFKPTQRTEFVFMHYYPDIYNHFIESKQCQGKLNFKFVNFIQIIIVGFCLLAYTIVLINKKMNLKYRILMIYIILALITNACICGIFSGAFPRYQARLVWLLPLPLFIYSMEFYCPKRILQLMTEIRILIFKK